MHDLTYRFIVLALLCPLIIGLDLIIYFYVNNYFEIIAMISVFLIIIVGLTFLHTLIQLCIIYRIQKRNSKTYSDADIYSSNENLENNILANTRIRIITANDIDKNNYYEGLPSVVILPNGEETTLISPKNIYYNYDSTKYLRQGPI